VFFGLGLISSTLISTQIPSKHKFDVVTGARIW